MPFNAVMIIGVIGLVLAIAVWFRTKRLGPVVAVLVTAFVVAAFTDTSILTAGAAAVGKFFNWIFSDVLTL